MIEHIKRVLRLVQKTGDRVVITDENGENSFVVIKFEDYEKLIESNFSQDSQVSVDLPQPPIVSDIGGLTEDQLLNKITQEIQEWKSVHKNE